MPPLTGLGSGPDWEVHAAIKELQQTFIDLDNSTKNQTKVMLVMTGALVALTVLLVVLTIVLIVQG